MKEPELITYELCWCDEQSTPECNVTNYIERVGSLQVQCESGSPPTQLPLIIALV